MRLGTKFSFLVIAILAITLGLTSVYLIEVQRQLAREQLLANSRSQGELLALIAPNAVIGYNFTLLDEYVKQLSNHPDIVFAAVFDTAGNALTSYLDRNRPAVRDVLGRMPGAGVGQVRDALATNKGMLVHNFPIARAGHALGELVIATDMRRIDAEIASIVWREVTAYGVIILVLGIAMYLVFRLEVLRPINALVRGARRVAGGNFEQRVESYARDELGTLTEAFNVMMADIRREREQLDFQANYDILTGLPNRKMALERIQQEIARTDRDGIGFAVMFVDLDNFKYINDSMGHAVGDTLLEQIGRRFKECIRANDLLARLGGDEYLVLLTSCTSVDTVQAVSDRLVASARQPVHIEGNDQYIGCSIGLAFYPEDGRTATALMAAADTAMYSAKNDTAASMHFFTKEMNDAARRRVEFERDIYAALAEGEFSLAFHPIVRTADFAHAGAEALIRWQHPDKGRIPPGDFIPLAERTGQITAIGEWVLANACNAMAGLQSEGLSPGFVSVNVSRRQISSGFETYVGEQLRKSRLGATRLVLEITENSLLDADDGLKSIFDSWHTHRIRLSLDDFGTGYSSLSCLRQFNFDIIKIDKSFVDGLPDNHDSRSLVTSIIAIAESLDMAVIAEGVETEAQRQCLQELGCDYVQGFLHRRPMDKAQYARYLSECQAEGRLVANSTGGASALGPFL